jgi:hypothetical protein
VYLFTEKGRTTPQIAVGASLQNLYGANSFDLRKPFTTHQTVLANLLNAEGNALMVERVIPADAGPKANFLLSLDLLATSLTEYERDDDGFIVKDPDTGAPVPVSPPSTINGYKAKWVVTSITSKDPDDADSDIFGVATQGPGDQTANSVQSTRYPILQFWADAEGSYYNNVGFRFWAPTVDNNVDTDLISSSSAYPLRMTMVKRATVNSTAKVTETIAGEPYFDFTFQPGLINPNTDSRTYLGDVYLTKYENTIDKRFPTVYADLHNFKIYQSNINTVLNLLYDAEDDYFTEPGNDFSSTKAKADQLYLYNLFSFANSNGVPYRTVQLNNTDTNAVRLSENTNVFPKGGSDCTLSLANFNALVKDAVSEYANPSSKLLDTAMYTESFIYDSGFPVDVKNALCNFIAIRKDTAVILSTHVVGNKALSATEDYSLAVSLRTKLQMFPESDYFGTPIVRGVIVGRSGVLRNSPYTERLPLSIELAVKAARFMGAGNGIWKAESIFDKAPNNLITLFDDVSEPFTPATQRNKDWDVGLNYAMTFSRQALYFPALKTVYNDDTSVLNSFFTMAACMELQKIGEIVHRRFSGVTSLTDAQLMERVNKAVDELAPASRFADMFKIVPAAYISEADAARGYSWTLPIKIYANNMKTVMTLSIESYRMSDYTN